MPLGRPIAPLVLSQETRFQVQSLSQSRSLPYSLVKRAQIILMASAGLSNTAIASKVGLSRAMVGVWRKRFLSQGVMGLYDGPKPGGPRSIEDERVAKLIRMTLRRKPRNGTHWSCRTLARETSISKSTIHRIWGAFGLQPHRQKHFSLSTDPLFVEKVRDIVGLYLNPPDKALVLCVDEKSQIQALERTQPILPMGLGYVEGVTHNYFRHGTTTLFAALNITTSKVIGQCKHRHRHQEFLQFLKHVDSAVPKDLNVHLIVDNYRTHKHHKVQRWIAAHPRYQIHYTPTYSSWLNQVEIWFNLITQKAIRRGTFRNVKELIRNIDRFVSSYNHNAAPFNWTATADSILLKIRRLCEHIRGTGH